METQFGRAPLASPLALAFRTGDASGRPLLQTPRNMHLEVTLSLSSEGARVPSPFYVGRRSPFAMTVDVSGTAFLFAAT